MFRHLQIASRPYPAFSVARALVVLVAAVAPISLSKVPDHEITASASATPG